MKKVLLILVLGLFWSDVSYSNMIMQDLIDVLVETKKPKSIEVAKALKLISTNSKSYDLVIRKANLNLEDAKKIANAINIVDQKKGPKLHTISMCSQGQWADEAILAISPSNSTSGALWSKW